MGGSTSIAIAAPSPHSPPIAMPYNARNTRKTVKFGENAVSSSKIEKKRDVDHQRRAAAEAVGEPSEDHRAERPAHQRQRDCERDFGNGPVEVVAMRVTTNVNSKKSNASSVHPRKHAMKVLRAAEVTRGVFAAGLRYGLGLEPAELVGEGLGLAEGVGVLPGGSVAP